MKRVYMFPDYGDCVKFRRFIETRGFEEGEYIAFYADRGVTIINKKGATPKEVGMMVSYNLHNGTINIQYLIVKDSKFERVVKDYEQLPESDKRLPLPSSFYDEVKIVIQTLKPPQEAIFVSTEKGKNS